jgi:hypothetical protein
MNSRRDAEGDVRNGARRPVPVAVTERLLWLI